MLISLVAFYSLLSIAATYHSGLLTHSTSAEKAVDGVYDTTTFACFFSGSGAVDSFWMVDLQQHVWVTDVILTNIIGYSKQCFFRAVVYQSGCALLNT